MAGIIRHPTLAQAKAIANAPGSKWYPGATNVNPKGQPVDNQGNVVQPAGFDPFGIGTAISSVTDFLQWIAWIFDPVNILRAVEFVVGLVLAGWGVYLFTRPRHGQPSGHPLRELFAMTPIGRASRIHQGRRMGRREGQREAARMEARRTETRGERTASAHERERINVSARASARRQREGQAHSRRVRGH